MGSTGFLEVIYGVLFDPVRTFRRLAEDPPLLLTLIIVTLVNAAGTLMGILTLRALGPGGVAPEIAHLVAPVAPFLALSGFFLWYAKWLGWGAILHLTAQLLGGSAGARGTLVAYGLAGLPAILLLPVEGLVVLTGLDEAVASPLLGLLGLGVFIWSVVLLVFGLREIHYFSTGAAVAAVLLPVAAIGVLLIILLVFFAFGLAAVTPALPSWF
jgi:hypothetical protein